MKRAKTMFLSLVLCISMLPCGMLVSAEEELPVYQYVVLKKINEGIEGRDIGVTLLKIGENTARSYRVGEQGIHGDIYYVSESPRDPLTQAMCHSAVYGDIYEYRGTGLETTQGPRENLMAINNATGDNFFEKVGSLFDAPTEDAKVRNIDGESVIEVTSAEGDTYLIYPGTPGDIRIELKHYQNLPEIGEKQDVLGDFNQDNVVNASDATFVLIYAAKHGAGTLTDNYEDVNNILAPIAKDGVALAESYRDFNHDGEVNASDASIILIYAAEHGAGTFSGSFEEYVNS